MVPNYYSENKVKLLDRLIPYGDFSNSFPTSLQDVVNRIVTLFITFPKQILCTINKALTML